ncbi:phage portal protein [Enterococcus termitis]|uniref:Phage portal protein n=1 Tax=Enterococcus termitis TaxID=332950 RepID=A0A1E5GU27_9ENTE|nr:phage portal protein [Enterococcus termitis]OEG16169.1 phage portal protein [Enterococcus termitis]OJG96811.1 HK97 family phage portal protein [Enterococcus termitis]
MSKRKRKAGKAKIRSEPTNESNVGFFISDSAKELFVSGYTRLSENPEVKIAVDKIADLVSNMTIHLMENTPEGDVRVKNELSRKLDINPYSVMTRKNWVYAIVYSMLLPGDGNSIVWPVIKNGLIDELIPLAPSKVNFIEDGLSYKVGYQGTVFDPDEIIHFAINPDPEKPWQGTGYRLSLKDITQNLKQATATKRAFMGSKYMPNIIVKVDGETEELTNEEGRKKIEEMYLTRSETGKPWIVPGEMIEVQQVKPLTLNDIAINDAVEIDKKTVAGLLGVPAFFLGVGNYNKDEYNNFITTKIMSIAQIFQQTLTKNLLVNPKWYFRCNARSLYAYDLEVLGNLGMNLYKMGLATGNEARGLVDFDFMEGLDELVILENYIPKGMIGDQKKLDKGGEEDE